MESKYKTQIQLLQQEVSVLQAQQESCLRELAIQHGDHLQELSNTIMKQKSEDGQTKKDGASRLFLEIQDLEEDLRRQTQINGISLTECCVKTLEKNDHKIIEQHRLVGNCSCLAFQVEFALTEILNSTLQRRITDLNIVVDSSEFKDFSVFVSGVEETSSLLLFFRTLKSFSEKCENRGRTYQYFKEKYPDVIGLPEGSRSEPMMIQSPRLPGCALNIIWNIDVTKDGIVTPKVDLLMKIPEQAQQMEAKKLFEDGPNSFQSLLHVLGVEATIESLIKAVCI